MTTIIGLTGGIASGKTTASAYFRDQGVPIIDADEIAHNLTAAHAPGSAAVANAFGPEFLDEYGAMDRRKMRELVFSDPAAKAKLEAILHPLIQERAAAAIKEAAKDHPMVIFDCALLLENERWRQLVDKVVVIDACDETRIARLAKRNGFSREEALAIIHAQLPREALISQADVVVVNEGEPQEFLLSLTDLYKKWALGQEEASSLSASCGIFEK